MGFFSKLMFWKRDTDLPDIDKELGKLGVDEADNGLGPMPGTSPSYRGGTPDFGKIPQSQSHFNYPNAPELSPPEERSAFSRSYPPTYQQVNSSDHNYIISKDIEVISSKLDALRAGIDSINQRLANLERIAGASEGQQRKYNW